MEKKSKGKIINIQQKIKSFWSENIIQNVAVKGKIIEKIMKRKQKIKPFVKVHNGDTMMMIAGQTIDDHNGSPVHI